MDWTRCRTVGRGSTATVSVATVNHSGHVFAVKSSELSLSESLRREQSILSTLSCPQIVAYKGCDTSFENGKLLYNLFMEYAPNGTVTDAIQRHGGGLDEATVRSYTRGILSGLEFLHGIGIVHCDIKGRNILVTDDGVKIADLGCARKADGSISGTPLYMAPEVARGEQQGFSADVWALGCTVIEMVTGTTPWPDIGDDPKSALYRIGFSSDVPEIPSNISKQGKDFLSKCLKREPSKRWSATELLEHDFVKEWNFAVKGTDGSPLETPTSVLYKQVWGTMEEEFDTVQRKPCLPTKCLMERMQLLVEDDVVFPLKMPDWDLDEDWSTVRSYGSNNVDESTSMCGDVGHDYDLGIDYYDLSEISGQKSTNSSRNVVECRFNTSLFMACKYATYYSNNMWLLDAFFYSQIMGLTPLLFSNSNLVFRL
ncbi:mitogen-activated protein kinase kinase kinase 18-like [Hibiscus syriacus]|uniref:mitogen-activated protein kinase kinase kinase 18-like n=1 Tax=Hibiscus syriacus TaxID=106335 RepID=UPI0019245700|nr:mitogen-activated protein kinase kinase kinase 18-like [Hibiscus syriacus]